MADTVSSSCPTLPSAEGYGFDDLQLEWIQNNQQAILQLIRDLQQDQKMITDYGFHYIDLPLSQAFYADPTAAGTLARLTPTDGTALGLYNGVTKGWPTLDWLVTTSCAATLTKNDYWHWNFRFPAAVTAAKVHFGGVCVDSGASTATTHSIGMKAYRARVMADNATEAFGVSPSYNGSDWTWNTDLCTTSAHTVAFKTAGTSQFTYYSFGINCGNRTYPIKAGMQMQLQFNSSVTVPTGGQTTVMYFSNFYVEYSGG